MHPINHDNSEPNPQFPSASPARANVLPTSNTARIDSTEVARLTGLKRRTVTAHADQGKIPGARRFGTKWTFDAETISA